MRGFVVSGGGTFGVVERQYVSDLTGRLVLLIRWGPLGWLTPVEESDVIRLQSSYESEARKEAEALLRKE